ncbi:MAG: thioredoxin family protein [Acidobacteriaceae bacterium]|nr:thioredoxin family protein [Acidobacteriaceae bacterium]
MRVLAAVLVFVLAVIAPVGAQRGPATAALTPLLEADPVQSGAPVHGALTVVLPEGYHTNSNKPRDPNLIPITLTFDPLPDGITIREVVFPPASNLAQRGADEPLSVFEHEFTIGFTFVATGTSEKTLSAELRYQACDEVACYAPKRQRASWTITPAPRAGARQHADLFTPIKWGTGEPPTIATVVPVAALTPASAATNTAPSTIPADEVAALDAFVEAGTTTGYVDAESFLTFIHNAEAGIHEQGMFDGRGPLMILLLVLVGGLALNLTPCVLPMIPINLAIIGAGARAGSRGRGFALGAVYGAAMAFVYGVLGLVVILTASTFGTINASPWFNLGIAILFAVLALAMFDVLVIDFSRFSSNLSFGESGSGSMVMAFGMGAVAALLAGACVAPVVIQVVLFSSNLYAGGTTIALALPFLLGIGMAIPWPIAGAGLAALPKPGPWMVRVKQLFGVLILVTSVYYGYEAYGLFSNRWVDANEVSSSVQEKLKEGWHSSLAEGLAASTRDGKPVLIDMWATWCKNCLVMDRTTLEDPAVTSALANYVKVKFQAENPDEPRVARVMQKLGAKGLPTYVILKPR